jgi:outer membrane protein TolC
MIHIGAWLTLFFIGCTVVLAEGTPIIPDHWTPENAVRFALANNPDIAITQQRIAVAQAGVQEAKAAFYPRLDLSASYQKTNTPLYSFGNILNQGAFNETINFNDPGLSDNLSMNATITYRLYSGGRDQAGLDAAEAGNHALLADMEVVRSQLAFTVVKTLFIIVEAEEILKARRAAAESIVASVQAAQARFEAGDLLKADLLNLEVRQAEAYEDVLVSQHGVNLAKRAFLNVLGLEEGGSDVIPNYAIEELIPKDLSFNGRPEFKELASSIKEAEALLRQSQGGYYPTIEAFAGYQIDKGFEFDGSSNSWQAGVLLNLNLFEGKKKEAKVSAAEAHLRALKQKQRKLSLAIKLEVEKAKLAMEQAQQRLLVTEKMVQQAEEGAALQRERFQEGLLLSSELIDAENRLLDAKVRRILAKSSQRTAVAELRRAVGLDQFDINMKHDTEEEMQSSIKEPKE